MRFSPVLFLSLASSALSWPSLFRSNDEVISSAVETPRQLDEMFATTPSGAPLLSDIIGLKQCTIMSDYTLNLKDIAQRLADPAAQTLILAPLNSAIMALPQKPWVDSPQNTPDKSFEVKPLRNEERAAKNIENFVKRHVVDRYPLTEGKSVSTLAGDKLSFEIKDGEKYINGKHKVVAEKQAANGAIWVISGVIEIGVASSKHAGL